MTTDGTLPVEDRGAELLRDLGRLLVQVLPDGADRLVFRRRALRSYAEVDAVPYHGDVAGPLVWPPDEASDLAEDLRDLCAGQETGAWFTMTMVVDRGGLAEVVYDYDSEPVWDGAVSDEAYVRDVERFPRAAEHVPEWLRVKLVAVGPVSEFVVADPVSGVGWSELGPWERVGVFAREVVRSGCFSLPECHDEVLNAVRDWLDLDLSGEDEAVVTDRVVGAEVAALRAEAVSWPAVTDVDRLWAACEELRGLGWFIGWGVHRDDLGNAIEVAAAESGVRPRGSVDFGFGDVARVVSGEQLWVTVRVVSEGFVFGVPGTVLMKEVAAVVRGHGVTVGVSSTGSLLVTMRWELRPDWLTEAGGTHSASG